ncbi:MAG: phenylalanine--tRNA ligase subunit beta [Chloroflexi bacterium]|nr:phenylalanine--tRNA ligase subunit beta [Chloroflexota bacterium]
MEVSLNWLKDYVDITISPEELAEKLTMVGLEASDVQVVGADWDNVFVAKVANIEKHPDADRLCLATVDLGNEQHTVVCGAPNIVVGQRIVFAKVGAKLFNPYAGKMEQLKPAKIRGVRSEGMVCSEKELGISDNHEGILVLSETAPIGKPLVEFMGDTVFDITVTPNRPDCLNMIGIAREIAAITGTELRTPEVKYDELETPTDSMIAIEIADPDLCSRYCGGIIKEVKIRPSPTWMQERLTAAGMRPINNIVDITNFVMLEYGQPLHAFDYEKIGGQKIIVRRGKEGEWMYTLDGEERNLTNDMLVIADAEHPVALAGVMGGEASEVTEQTTTILLESANFNNVSIRRTSRGLGLISEASSRFDKGLSPELPMYGVRRAIQLMVELGGGKATQGIVDAYPERKEKLPIVLSQQKVKRVLGIDFGMEHIKGTLQSLGFECEEKGSVEMSVTVPYWRTDVTIAEDLIEEVARVIGYDEIPTTMLSGEIPHHEPTPLISTKDQIRDTLVGCGMQEIINYSLTSMDVLDRVQCADKYGEPVRMANPLSREQEYLRVSLRGGLFTYFGANERFQDKGIMLFEVGKVYIPREGELPDEREMLCGVIGGSQVGQSWLDEKGAFDFFYAKGILQMMFNRLGVDVVFESGSDELLLPGKTATIMVDGETVGVVGEVHPDIAASFDISSDSVCMFEIEIDKIVDSTERLSAYEPIPRFPSTDRDLALVVDTNLPAQEIQDVILGFQQVREATVFDVYQGKQVPEGKKSLAFALRYQSMERTLTDEEVDKVEQKILKKLENEVGAVLRH